MTDKLSTLLKKYSVPLLFFIFGLLMLLVGIAESQNSMFMTAAVLMLVAGGLSILYSTGKLNPKLLYIIGIGSGIIGLFTIFMSWKGVNDTATYNQNYKDCKALAKQNLEDIRYIQKAYAESKGTYLKDWESFIEYAKTGTVPLPVTQGVLPSRKIDPIENNYLYTGNPAVDNNMSEKEAFRLSKWQEGPNWERDFKDFVRDTIQVSLLKIKFESKSYKDSRVKAGFHVFSPDSLPFIPFTNGNMKWTLETKESVQVGETHAPAIRVAGKIPFARIKGKDGDTEEMHFGTLTSNDTSGSWEE
jgi:hypothetical protein